MHYISLNRNRMLVWTLVYFSWSMFGHGWASDAATGPIGSTGSEISAGIVSSADSTATDVTPPTCSFSWCFATKSQPTSPFIVQKWKLNIYFFKRTHQQNKQALPHPPNPRNKKQWYITRASSFTTREASLMLSLMMIGSSSKSTARSWFVIEWWYFAIMLKTMV